MTSSTNPQAVRLIAITPDAEKIMAYCARVSNPKNQDNPNISQLLSFCIILEINTSRGIAPQILRHRSFTFQEFSQRYAPVQDFVEYEARRQDLKNRQNSVDDLDEESRKWFSDVQKEIWELAYHRYSEALEKGIAKECARFLLPLGTKTRLYMNGTIRSWIHYLQLRTGHGTQKEHMEIANECEEIFIKNLPLTAEALGWMKQGPVAE